MHAVKAVLLRVTLLVVGLGLLAACTATGSRPEATPPAKPATPPATQVAPALDGATLLNDRCTLCHTLDRVKNAKKMREQWDKTVTRMIGKGANLTEAEKTLVLDSLAKTHGP